MAEQFYPNVRNFEVQKGLHAEIEAKVLKHGVKRRLRNYFGKYGLSQETGALEDMNIPVGHIENIVMEEGIKRMAVGAEELDFSKSSTMADAFPEGIAMGNAEGEKDLYNEVLKTITDKNRFLARQWPYVLVFAQYLGEVEQEKAEAEGKERAERNEDKDVSTDPTKQGSADTPSDTPTSDSVTIEKIA